MIDIKRLDRNKTKVNEKSYKHIFVYHTGYVTVKNLRYIEINSVNLLYLMINKINVYTEESNGNKYLMLIPTNESK